MTPPSRSFGKRASAGSPLGTPRVAYGEPGRGVSFLYLYPAAGRNLLATVTVEV